MSLVFRGIDADYSTDNARAGDIEDAHYESVSYRIRIFDYKAQFVPNPQMLKIDSRADWLLQEGPSPS